MDLWSTVSFIDQPLLDAAIILEAVARHATAKEKDDKYRLEAPNEHHKCQGESRKLDLTFRQAN